MCETFRGSSDFRLLWNGILYWESCKYETYTHPHYLGMKTIQIAKYIDRMQTEITFNDWSNFEDMIIASIQRVVCKVEVLIYCNKTKLRLKYVITVDYLSGYTECVV